MIPKLVAPNKYCQQLQKSLQEAHARSGSRDPSLLLKAGLKFAPLGYDLLLIYSPSSDIYWGRFINRRVSEVKNFSVLNASSFTTPPDAKLTKLDTATVSKSWTEELVRIFCLEPSPLYTAQRSAPTSNPQSWPRKWYQGHRIRQSPYSFRGRQGPMIVHQRRKHGCALLVASIWNHLPPDIV